VTLAATNHEQLLDTAVWRRFDARIEIPEPDAEARGILLKNFLTPISVRADEMRFLVWATEGMSGADIKILVEAGKRFLVLHGPDEAAGPPNAGRWELASRVGRASLTREVLRRQAALNPRLFAADRAALLAGANEALDQGLEDAGFTQAQRGVVLGLSQSAVSRLRKRVETEETNRET
jgi:SpoVK/Ycf46/Vps4 family AAA+-type ATPase